MTTRHADNQPFEFLDPGELSDGEIRLEIEQRKPADPARGWVPSYIFGIRRVADGRRVGRISLRIGDSEFIRRYAGHIGYGVDEDCRGHRYAAKACRLVAPLAGRHGLRTLWITVNPDNLPSRRTCEIIGAELVETVDVPPGNDMYDRGERRKCRYRYTI